MITITRESSGDFNEFRRHVEAAIHQWQEDCEREARHVGASRSPHGRAYTAPAQGLAQTSGAPGWAGRSRGGGFQQRQLPQRPARAVQTTGRAPMPMRPVHSSIIAEVGYEPRSQQLCLAFVSGCLWLYHDVPPAHYRLFQESPSLGSFFNHCIKGVYPSQRL